MSKILIYGMGKSGVYATKLALLKQYEVDIYDSKKIEQNMFLQSEKELLNQVDHAYFTEMPFVFNDLKNAVIYYDFVVISPGVDPNKGVLKEFQEHGGKIISEVEFSYRNSIGKFIGITGTNGKTTTTTLCYRIFQNQFGNRVRLVGNVGIPISKEVIEEIEQGADDRIYICELSSYQLEYIDIFKCEIAAILNITPDHLQRHGDMNGYIAAKCNIAKNLKLEDKDVLILNYDDEILKNFENDSIKIRSFSVKDISQDYFLKNSKVSYQGKDAIVEVFDVKELSIFGEHNYSNALCAAAIAIEYGVAIENVQKGLKEFKPIEHRMEFVMQVDGISYFNDSKATNPEASIPAIQSMKEDTILIAGGSDKKSDYREWISKFDKISLTILMGDTAADIARSMDEMGCTGYEFAMDMRDALNKAINFAREHKNIKNILLSPACASFDKYENYECRGRDFKKIVAEFASL